MTSNATGWRRELAFPSLSAALLSIRHCRIEADPENHIDGGSVAP
jgi:hypothetical protein